MLECDVDEGILFNDENDPRSNEEIIAFKIIYLLLLIARILTLIYFAKYTSKYVLKVGKGQRDRFTMGTFAYLGISYLLFLIHRSIILSLDISHFLVKDNPEQH